MFRCSAVQVFRCSGGHRLDITRLEAAHCRPLRSLCLDRPVQGYEELHQGGSGSLEVVGVGLDWQLAERAATHALCGSVVVW
jgi:hypothetical protein